MKYVKMLLHHQIKPILVFDGQHLPAKELTEKKRREYETNFIPLFIDSNENF